MSTDDRSAEVRQAVKDTMDAALGADVEKSRRPQAVLSDLAIDRGFDEDVSPIMFSIIEHATVHADRLNTFAKQQLQDMLAGEDSTRIERRRVYQAQRDAIVLRDSLTEVAALLRGVDLDEDQVSFSDLDTPAVRAAQAYSLLKNHKFENPEDEKVVRDAMSYINGNKSIGRWEPEDDKA